MQRILVVDDDAELRKTLRTVLKLKGFEVIEADNGNTALELARNRLPDLIISDIEMPGADGLQELEELRKNPATAHIGLILMTGRQQAKQREGMELGADDFLFKPFHIGAMLKSVEARLKKQSAWKQVAENGLQDLRSQITTNLPREFSAPLSEVMVFSEVLETCADELNPDKIRELARGIREHAGHLERTIKNFVLYSRLATIDPTSREITAMRSQVTEDLPGVVAHAARERAEIAGRTADLHFDLHGGRVEIDSELLTKIVHELVDNALRLSAPGTQIAISNREISQFSEITISDQGPGLTARQIDTIGPFVKFEPEGKRSTGLGLGLAIARKLADLHGGNLDIQSIPEQGTKVVIRLPAHLQLLRDQPASDKKKKSD